MVVKDGENTIIDLSLSDQAQELAEVVVKAKTIKRSENALMMLQRSREAATPDVDPITRTDSSPIAGYDWLWSQYHEFEKRNVVPVFQAVVD